MKNWGFIVFVVALVVRLAWGLAAHVTPFSDFAGYDRIARQWLETGELGHSLGRAYRTPGYPALLAGVYGVAGANYAAVAVVQAVLGAFTAALLVRLGARLASLRVGVVAGLLYAFSLVAVTYVPVLASENLAVFLFVAALTCVEAGSARGWGWWAAAGVLLGALLLTRPVTVFVAPVLGLLALWDVRGRSVRWRAPLIMVAGLLVTLAPWSLRNARLGLSPWQLSTQGGVSLWWGNNPRERSGNGDGMADFQLECLPEREREAYCRRRALAWIASHPGRYAGLSVVRLVRLFGTEPDWVAARHLVPTAENDRALRAFDAPGGEAAAAPQLAERGKRLQAENRKLLQRVRRVTAPLALLALLLATARWRAFALLQWPVAAYAVGASLTVVDARYRLLIDPLIYIVLAALLLDLARRSTELGARPAWRWKVALAGAGVLTGWLIHAWNWDEWLYRLPPA